MNTLDKTKPFGIIMGDTEGRAFEQDHRFFGADEKEIVTDAPADKPKAKKVVTDAPAAVDAQLAAQLGDA